MYSSTALVRIAFMMPVVRSNPGNDSRFAYELFMQEQTTTITSRRVIDEAIQDPVWRTMGVAVPENPVEYFDRRLNVATRPNSELIQISVTDENPVVAATR